MTTFKGLFINQIAKDVTWPKGYIKDTLKIAILNENDLSSILKKISKKHVYGPDSIPIEIYDINNLDDIQAYHVLYVNYKSGYDPERLFRAIEDLKTLLITENYDYGTTMINFLTNKSRIKFELNLATIEAKKMVLANRIIDNAEKGTEEDWQTMLLSMRRKLNTEESINREQTKKIEEMD